MYSRLLKAPRNKSFFLLGPRGTGKTTWVRTNFQDSIYIDLLEAQVFNDLLAQPQRINSYIPPQFKNWIIIDEVQRVPDLLHEVHRLIESKKYKFILTGSSARKLKRAGPNLLAGRALSLSMSPLSVSEVGDDFDMNKILQFGQLPSIYSEENPKQYLESYVKTYLEEEIRQEGLTRTLAAFARFLESASFSQGSVLNVSSVARDCAVERKVVENYFTILEDLLIAYRIPIFSKRSKRRLTLHSKFYFFDVGIYRTIRPMGPLDSIEEVEGIALETLFFQELMTLNNSLGLGYRLYYWRTSNGQEVDFVLYGPRGLFVFEIKRTGKFKIEMLSGIQSFLREYPMAKSYLVYMGERSLFEGKTQIIPAKKILQNLINIL
ncbi:MAG: ATP-binding protein [Elusimicrobiota bacterium]